MRAAELLRIINTQLTSDPTFPVYGSTFEPIKNELSITIVDTQETFIIKVLSEDTGSLTGLAKIAIKNSDSKIQAIKELRSLCDIHLGHYLGLKEAKDIIDQAWGR